MTKFTPFAKLDKSMLTAAKSSWIQSLAAGLFQVFPRLLGALLIYTASQKILHPGMMEAVFSFDGLPQRIQTPLTWTIIVIEVGLGTVLLTFVWFRAQAIIAAIVLLSLYVVQIGYLLIWDNAPYCGCIEGLAEFQHARTMNMLSLARNICLILPALWTWARIAPASKPGFPMEETP